MSAAGPPQGARPLRGKRREATHRGDPTSESGSPVIDVKGLDKSFGDKHVVVDLSLKVERGEIFGFLGPNGSGKTTSIRLMCGLLTPDAGSGTCLGYDIRTRVGRDQAQRRLHDAALFVLGRPHDRRESRFRRARLRDEGPQGGGRQARSPIWASRRVAGQLTGTLSGGWKQRLALAACMLHKPRLLLLDEPTAGVDPNARREFWEELHRLAARESRSSSARTTWTRPSRCHKLAYIAYGRCWRRGRSLT